MPNLTEIGEPTAIETKDLSFYYAGCGEASLKTISLAAAKHKVTALIGPSGCGKSTLLRAFNRIHDLYPGNRYEGSILFDGRNILGGNEDLIRLRMKIGMIFQKPTPFPMSIFDNVAYGLKLQGIQNRSELADRVEDALKGAALWEEVSDRLADDGNALSGGQQQRLCIARAVAVEPEILLFDEPTSALDPLATQAIEELVIGLKKRISIIIVTHNMQQAARISDDTAFMYLGELIELGRTKELFVSPKEEKTEQYISGKFG